MPRSRSSRRRPEPAQPASGPIVALVVDAVDWHARALIKALRGSAARAPCRSRCRRARSPRRARSGLRIPGFDDRLPDAVMVRTMSGGTFEAVTLRLGMLHALRELGVPVWNDARAIERCVDKSMTSFLLARAGIPTPATWATESREAAREIVRREAAHGPLVLKPLFGSQGRGLRLIRDEADLPGAGDSRRRLLSAALRRRRTRRLPRFPPVRVAGPRHRRHGAACAELDHQREARRPAGRRRGRCRDEGPRRPRRRRGRRRFRRRRYPARRRRTADRARGQQHAGVVGPAEGDAVNIAAVLAGDLVAALAARTRRGAAV